MPEALKIALCVLIVLAVGLLAGYPASFQRPNNPWTKRWARNHPDTAARWQHGPHKSGEDAE